MKVTVRIKQRMFTLAGHRKVMKQQIVAALTTIQKEYWPKHFQREAFTRYRGVYQPRQARYTRWKHRVVGHNLPNVLSGNLQRNVLQGSSPPTATQSRGRLRARMGNQGRFVSGPRAGQSYPRALPVQRAREIEAVSGDELRELANEFGLGYVRSVDTMEPKYVLAEFR